MTVRVRAAVEGNLGASTRAIRSDVAADVTIGLRGVTDGAVQDMRQALERAFPNSRRMATMVTGKTTPDRPGVFSLDAAGRIYGRGSKRSAWPAPLWAQAFGAEIQAKDGGSLAIPTKAVPRDGRNRPLSPTEVEVRFGEKLKAIPAGVFGKRGALVLYRQTIGRSGRVRAATRGRARQGRRAQPIVMFWLVPQVSLRPRWDPREIMGRWADLAPAFVERAAAARKAATRDALIERGAMMRRGDFIR